MPVAAFIENVVRVAEYGVLCRTNTLQGPC